MTDNHAIYPDCGTLSAARRHTRHKTPKCAGCKRAMADYMQNYRHANGISKARLIPDTLIQKHGIKVNA